MPYRVCISVIPAAVQIEDPVQWEGGQVHQRYPKMSGVVAEYFVQMIMTAVLGNSAPNISLVFESGTGSVGKDGSPTGCYASIHNNGSDFTFFPVEYPIYDYSKVNPVQVLYEKPLNIISNYRVEDKVSIVYADLLQSSLNSFDIIVWLLVIMTFFVFAVLLKFRKRLRKFKEVSEYKPVLQGYRMAKKPAMKESSYTPLFETFVHMIGQDCTDFVDRSGNLISFIMTISFFLILVFYLNLISAELVVVNKPRVISNYRDVMNGDMAVAFVAMRYDATEFEKAQEGTIQHEFWKKYSETRIMLSSKEPMAAFDFMNKVSRQKGVIIMNSIASQVFLELNCKLLDGMKAGTNLLGKTHDWLSSDPEGKQHTNGLIIRQGLNTQLIIKGQRRLKGVFEGSLLHQTFKDSVGGFDLGPIMAGTSYSNIRECMSKQVHYNHPKVENYVWF